jgi:hypothetical protein
LPSAISLTGLGSLIIWRISSACAALSFTAFLVALYRRRRTAVPGPSPFRTRLNFVVSGIATLALWLSAVGVPYPPGPAPYALALTWFLVLGGLVFVQNLEVFIQH